MYSFFGVGASAWIIIRVKSGSSTGLKEFDIVPYGKFKDYPGDGLTGHELL